MIAKHNLNVKENANIYGINITTIQDYMEG
jgi:hypothetical protein